MPNKISPYSYVIHPEGESAISESAYIVSRDDEGAGEYITIADGFGNKIRIDADDIKDLFTTVRLLQIKMEED